MGGVVSGVFDAVGDVVEGVVDVVEDVVDGIGDTLGDIGELAVDVVSSPVGQIAMYAIPELRAIAPYVTASAKVASGQDLSLFDVATLGMTAYGDISTANWVDPDVALKVKTAAAIADGGDPAKVLLANYGTNWANEMGITDTVTSGLSDVLDADTMSFVNQNINFDQVARDLVSGASPERLLANQFGETVVNNLSSGDPNLQALGKAGITSAVALSEGATDQQALLAGGKTYYNEGGALPNFGDLAGQMNLDLGNIDMPDLGLGFLADIGKDIYSGIKEFGLPDIQLNLGIDVPSLENVDWGQFKIADFGGISLPDLGNLGVNINQLQDMPQLKTAVAFQGILDQAGQTAPAAPEDVYGSFYQRSTDNDLLADTGVSRARQLLSEV